MKTTLYGIGVGGLLAASSLSASTVSGTIYSVVQRASDGLTYVAVIGTPTARPPCAQSTSYYMIRDENSEAGKKQYAMLLAAKVSGMQIIVTGSGTCTRWGDGEDINHIQLIG